MLKSIVKALGGKKTLLSEAPASRVVADTFAIKRIAHYGSVSRPVLVKYDSLTHLTAVVGDDGGIKVYGTDGTEAYKRLPQNAALPSGLFFFGNEGSFIVHDSNCIYFFDTKQSTDLPYSTVPIEHGIASCDVALGEDVAVVGDCTGCIIGVVLSKCAVSEFKVPLSQVIPTPHEKDEDHATPSKADGTSDASPEAGTDSSSSSSSAKENAPVITVKANPVHPALLLVHYSLPYNFLCTWSVPAGKVLFTYNLAMMPLVTSLAWDKSGDKFAASHEDGSVSMWRCKDPKKPKCVFHAKDKVLKSDDEPPITEMNFARADSENMLVYLAGKGCTKRLCALRGDFENPSKVTAIEPFCSPVASYALVPPLKSKYIFNNLLFS